LAVEAPQVAAVAERLAVARGRQHGDAGRGRVPHAEGGVRQRHRLDPQVLERPGEIRDEALARERQPHDRPGDPVVVMDLADALHRPAKALVDALEERDLLFFGLRLLRHRVPNARTAARGSGAPASGVTIPLSRRWTRSARRSTWGSWLMISTPGRSSRSPRWSSRRWIEAVSR